MSLYTCVEMCQSKDRQAMLELVNKFKPLIRKYSRNFFYEDIETDLTIALLQTSQKLNLCNFDKENEGALVIYFSTVVRNTYIDAVKKSKQHLEHITLFEKTDLDNFEGLDPIKDLESSLEVDLLLKGLSMLQKEVILDIFIFEKSEVEIAKKRHITKQAVSNTKTRALKKLRENYIEKGELNTWKRTC